MLPVRMLIHTISLAAVFVIVATTPSTAQEQAWMEGAGYLQLIDRLDRPLDGYCLDIIGSGQHIRFDLPLIAHNCKEGLYADEAVELEKNGYIRFPAYGKCATVAGLNGRALPGTALMVRECGEVIPFMDAEKLQKFRLRKDGMVELGGSGLCLTVGRKSESTFSPDHRWRALFVEACEEADPARSRWRFIIPGR